MNVSDWWSGLIGKNKVIDPEKDYIICFNSIGSCYGSTGPESIDPRTGEKYGKQFPQITIRDIARSQLLALEVLGIRHAKLGIGGSMGAMVLLELALLAPDLFEKIVPIACGASHTAWRIAFSSVICKTIERTANAYAGTEEGYVEGMKLARQIGMISYRSSGEFENRFARDERGGVFEVEHYLEHQGEKIALRFSPYSYLRLTEAMESYDLASGREGNIQTILSDIDAEVLCIGIDSDILYPEWELSVFSSYFSKAEYKTLSAPFGHDSFLVADAELARFIAPFITSPTYSITYHEQAV
jgi:homoserine O-acetyltransferase